MKRILLIVFYKALYAVMMSGLMIYGVIHVLFTRGNVRKFMQECSSLVYEGYLDLCDILED